MKHPTPPSRLALYVALLLTGVLTGCASSDRDGARVDEDDGSLSRTAVVTYAFGVPAPAGALATTGPLVSELAQDANLGRLTVTTPSNEQSARELDVEFVFGTVDAFLAWREQDETASLLDRVAALQNDTSAFRPRLSVRRPALYQSIIGRVEAGGRGGRRVDSVTCNEDCSRIEVKYKTRANEAGGGGPGQGEGTGDAGDIDSITLICQPGLAGTIEECKASN